MDIFYAGLLWIKKYRNKKLNIVDDFIDKALKIRRWLDRYPSKAKFILQGKVLRNKQERYYYKDI